MKSLVADTNALVRHLVTTSGRGRAARRRFEEIDVGRSRCLVPAIVLAEWWMLYERGRVSVSPARVLSELAGHPSCAVLPLDVTQVMEGGALTTIRDPMDRLTAAAARSADAEVLSSDAVFDEHGVRRVWE